MTLLRTSNWHLQRFELNRKGFGWALKLFCISIGLTVGFWMMLFVLSTAIFTSPEPVASTTLALVTLMMHRAVELESRVGLRLTIFALNMVATLVASVVSALLLLSLPFEVSDVKYRHAHPIYTKLAKTMDTVGYLLLWKPLFTIVRRLDSSFTIQGQPDQTCTSQEGIWSLCGYSGTEFRSMFSIFPFVIPALTAIANGIIFGMILIVTIVMGAYEGALIAGLSGLFSGAIQQSIYFLVATMPHGLIELGVAMTTITVGYSFASQYAREIVDHRLLIDSRLAIFEGDVNELVFLTKQFLKSRLVFSTLLSSACLLWIAAYIEVNITPTIIEWALTIVS